MKPTDYIERDNLNIPFFPCQVVENEVCSDILPDKGFCMIFYLIYIGRFSKLPGYPHQVLALLCAFFFYP